MKYLKTVNKIDGISGVFLVHNSNTVNKEIAPSSRRRPKFYWFSDRYFNHITKEKLNPDVYRYVHFIYISKDKSVKLFARHSDGTFESVWEYYLSYLKNREDPEIGYNEPPVVMSFSKIKPALIGEVISGDSIQIVSPKKFEGVVIKLLKEGKSIRYDEIKEIQEIIPDIVNSVPFKHPSQEEIINPSKFWTTDKIYQGRMWL